MQPLTDIFGLGLFVLFKNVLFIIHTKSLKMSSMHRGNCSLLDVGTVWRGWRS